MIYDGDLYCPTSTLYICALLMYHTFVHPLLFRKKKHLMHSVRIVDTISGKDGGTET